MPKSLQLIVESYNSKFTQHQLTVRIVSWTREVIKLNTNVSLEGTERRKFQSRSKSKMILPHFDVIYSIADSSVRDGEVQAIQAAHASKTNKQHWNSLPDDEREVRVNRMRQIQKLSPPYNQRKPRYQWNLGKTKDTDDRLLQMSISRKGAGNPMFGRFMSEDEKRRKSELIKSRILTGEWTPHVHNSRTHWQCIYNDRKYRSSWEAMYAYLNPTDEYEKIRVQYEFEGKRKIYIVDFVNHATKTLTEIKPQTHMESAQFLQKQSAARDWCSSSGYVYRVLTERYFVDNYHLIDFNDLIIPNIREKLLKIKQTST